MSLPLRAARQAGPSRQAVAGKAPPSSGRPRRGAPRRRFVAVATRIFAAEQETADIMTGANTDHAIIAAFRGGTSVAAIARRCGRPPRAVEWLLKKAGLKTNDRRRPRADDAGDAAPENPVRSCRRQDLAFQKAMRRAVAAGQENPPMIGVFKDARPSNAPRLFVPMEISSGCGSPARECADLDAGDAGVAGAAGVGGAGMTDPQSVQAGMPDRNDKCVDREHAKGVHHEPFHRRQARPHRGRASTGRGARNTDGACRCGGPGLGHNARAETGTTPAAT